MTISRHSPRGERPPEQSRERGVYIDVFEQFLLTDAQPSKSWSFFASLSAELLALSLAIVIPLVRTDHLPGFHWKSVTLGAPIKPLEPAPVARTSSAIHPGPTYPRRVFVYTPAQATPVTRAETAESFSIEPLGPIGLDGPSPARGIEIETLVPVPTIARPPHPSNPTNARSGPVPVSGGVQLAKLVKKVIPEYPLLAKTARVSGVVHLVGVIARDGTIQNLQLISGHPLLARAAIEAVRQWVYEPTLLNGQSVEVIAPIDVNFTLGQ